MLESKIKRMLLLSMTISAPDMSGLVELQDLSELVIAGTVRVGIHFKLAYL